MGDMFGAEGDQQVEMIGVPKETTINDADVQLAEFLVVEDEQTVNAKFAVFNNGEQAAVVLALGPEELWDENVALVDAIIESVELYEGSGLDLGELPPAEGIDRGSLVYDTVVEDEFAEAETHGWTFEGSAGDYVSVIVTPLDDEMDITIQLLAADLTVLADVDGGFSGEVEALQNYQLPADGEYQILIDEFWDVSGGYQLELLGGEEPMGALVPPGSFEMGQVVFGEPNAGLLMEGQDHVWTLTAEGVEVVTIVVDPMEDEVDLTVAVISPNGSFLVDEHDGAFSGDAEELPNLELSMPGDYLILVREYWDSGGSYELSVDLVTGE
jgi:hypothetical protein